MNPIDIIATSKDRAEAIARLVDSGYSRQEAKAMTFMMNAYAGGMGAKRVRLP